MGKRKHLMMPSNRSVAQFFFEVGFASCFSEAFIRSGVVPFEYTDAIVERAWDIAPEAHPDSQEFVRYETVIPEILHALQEAKLWLTAALNCKEWHWDSDQRQAAEDTLSKIGAAITKAEQP